MSKFVHLHTHSHYSLLNALPKIPELVGAAKTAGMNAIALTDNGNLYGAIEFYKECKKEYIKPIIGIDAYVAVRTRKDKQAGVDNRRARLVLLAKNMEGYKNLIKLVTDSHLEGFYYKPRIDHELIEKYHAGLIAISPSFSGEITLALKNGDTEKAEELLNWYKNIFEENLYLEITHHPDIEGHEKLTESIIALGKKTNTPLVAAHDVYYLNPEDKKARDTMISIQSGSEIGERNTFGDDTSDFSFINGEQAEEFFKKHPEAIENTAKIADACDLEIKIGKWFFPAVTIPKGSTADDELRKLAYGGIEMRGLTKTKEVEDRIEYELKTIKDKGYAGYFLVVSDLLRFAHENKILTTIRGSVAGSLVTYLSRITNVNPLEYKIPFERFLNPERPSAPDIDMDYADNRRDEVIAYAREKYGADKVAQIGTFGTMMARGSVRDVSRALGFAYSIGDRIAKLIPMGAQGFPMTIERALEEVKELSDIYKKEEDAKTILDMAKKIEGCARHISVHAAGVVIAPTPLIEYVPLQYDPKSDGESGSKIITQYDMYSVGEDGIGLLKFDFLGIKNLSILANSVALANKIAGVNIDIENIPLDDKKTFEILAKGETTGLFQLNGTGMTKFLKELKPSTIHDVNAMVALYRPGPLESIPRYIERKHNPLLVRYLDPRMREILDQSYGVITYQDDVLLIAIKLGGYSWLEADKLRKAMGKKIPAEMEAQKEKLQEAFQKNGMTHEKAEELWKLIEPFAAYGFNKAHAASYGKVAYQTAYMKANFPSIYMAAVLTADAGDVEKIGEFIAECKRMKIPVLPPSINESFRDFTVVKNENATRVVVDEIRGRNEQRDQSVVSYSAGAGGVSDKEVRHNYASDDEIRFGLLSIKNFGEGIGDSIISERAKNGKFTSIDNFLDRIKDRNLNKKSLEALIKCGAMDELAERGLLLGNVEGLLSYNKEKNKVENQDSLFGAGESASSLRLKPASPAEKKDKLAWEKELLGLYVSGHPLEAFAEKLANKISIQKIKETMRENMMTVVSGIVEEVKPIQTKKGDQMAFVKVSDLSGTIEVVAFSKPFNEFKALLFPESCIAIKGRISNRNGVTALLAEAIKKL